MGTRGTRVGGQGDGSLVPLGTSKGGTREPSPCPPLSPNCKLRKTVVNC